MNPDFVFIAGARLQNGTWVTSTSHTRDGALRILRQQYGYCNFTETNLTKYKHVLHEITKCGPHEFVPNKGMCSVCRERPGHHIHKELLR